VCGGPGCVSEQLSFGWMSQGRRRSTVGFDAPIAGACDGRIVAAGGRFLRPAPARSADRLRRWIFARSCAKGRCEKPSDLLSDRTYACEY